MRWVEEHGKADYLWSKQAINAYVARQAFAFLKRGIRINAIMPGPTDTPLAQANAEMWLGFAPDYRGEIGIDPSTPLEQAYALAFLCSDAASVVNGITMITDAATQLRGDRIVPGGHPSGRAPPPAGGLSARICPDAVHRRDPSSMRIGLMIGPERGRYRSKVERLRADAGRRTPGWPRSGCRRSPTTSTPSPPLRWWAMLRRASRSARRSSRCNPAIALAQQALSVQAVCEGRLSLGLGVSHHWIIDEMLGLPYERPAPTMESYLDVLDRAFNGPGPVDVENDLFRVHNPLDITDVTPTPVLGPVMLRVAGERTDGTILWMADERVIATHVVPSITRAAEAAGRAAPRVVAGIPVAFCRDDDRDRRGPHQPDPCRGRGVAELPAAARPGRRARSATSSPPGRRRPSRSACAASMSPRDDENVFQSTNAPLDVGVAGERPDVEALVVVGGRLVPQPLERRVRVGIDPDVVGVVVDAALGGRRHRSILHHQGGAGRRRVVDLRAWARCASGSTWLNSGCPGTSWCGGSSSLRSSGSTGRGVRPLPADVRRGTGRVLRGRHHPGGAQRAHLAHPARAARRGVTYRHPSVFATQMATLDHASHGRLELSLGAAWFEKEHIELGIPFPTTGERFDLLEDALEIVTRLMTGEEVSYDGRKVSLKDARVLPTPVQTPHPPVWIGGSGPKRTLPLVARYANVWHVGHAQQPARPVGARTSWPPRPARLASIQRASSLSLDDLDTARRHAEKWRDVGYDYLVRVAR